MSRSRPKVSSEGRRSNAKHWASTGLPSRNEDADSFGDVNPGDGISTGQVPASTTQKYGTKAATAIARLAPSFFSTSRLFTTDDSLLPTDNHKERNEALNIGVAKGAKSFNQARSQIIEKPVSAIDTSPDGSHILLAGRGVLRTAVVASHGTLHEDIDVIRQINARHRDQLAIVDVRWSRHHGNLIATAAGSGRIVLYDLNRQNFELATLYEHVRQVHKLAFHPHGGPLFLSGSHDGCIKLWDIRDVRDSRNSKATFQGSSQGIRDVKWSTTDAVEFASGTDGGVVQRWDMRKASAPILHFNAHDQVCHAIDYHPTSKHLATAGMDKRIKIWDTTRTERRQNPIWQIQAPQSVYNVSWRPNADGLAVSGDHVLNGNHTTELAASYDMKDTRIHVWDLKRQSVPSKEIDYIGEPTTSLLWHSNEILWTAGGGINRGYFAQSEMHSVSNPLERLNVNIMSIAPNNDMTFFSEDRQHGYLPPTEDHNVLIKQQRSNVDPAERLSTSLDFGESDLGSERLLSSIVKERKRLLSLTKMSTRPLESEDAQSLLESSSQASLRNQLMKTDDIFNSSQSAFYGHVHGVFDSEVFIQLANEYKLPTSRMVFNTDIDFDDDIESIFLENSNEATQAGDDGLAHTWRILAWAVKKEMKECSFRQTLKQSRKNATRETEEARDNVASIWGAKSVHAGSRPAQDVTSKIKHQASPHMSTPKVQPNSYSENVMIPHSEPLESPDKLSFVTDNSINDTVEDSSAYVYEEESSNAPHSGPTSAYDTTSTWDQELDQLDGLTARRIATSTFRTTPRPLIRFDGMQQNYRAFKNLKSAPDGQDVGSGLQRSDSEENFDVLSESTESRLKDFTPRSHEDISRSSGTSASSLVTRLDYDRGISQIIPVDSSNSNRSHSHAVAAAAPMTLIEPHGLESGKGSATEISKPNEQSTPSRDSVVLRPNRPLRSTIHLRDVDTKLHLKHAEDVLEREEDEASTKPNECLPSSSLVRGTEPWHASSFLPALLEHYIDRLSSLQLPVFLVLYLHRVFPSIFPTSFWEGRITDTSQNQRESSKLTPTRISMLVLSYHAQLFSLRQYVAAASLRRSFETLFPVVNAKVTAGRLHTRWCRVCGKPSKGRTKGLCSRCQNVWGGCSICGILPKQRIEPQSREYRVQELSSTIHNENVRSENCRRASSQHRSSKKTMSRWFYCQTCGHSGHSSCLKMWFSLSTSGGCCPSPGCQHACGPGAHRDETRLKLARRKTEASQLRRGNGVLQDDKVAHESSAVKTARPNAMRPESGTIWIDRSSSGSTVPTPAEFPMESVRFSGLSNERLGARFGGARGRWRTGRSTARNSVDNGGDNNNANDIASGSSEPPGHA